MMMQFKKVLDVQHCLNNNIIEVYYTFNKHIFCTHHFMLNSVKHSINYEVSADLDIGWHIVNKSLLFYIYSSRYLCIELKCYISSIVFCLSASNYVKRTLELQDSISGLMPLICVNHVGKNTGFTPRQTLTHNIHIH